MDSTTQIILALSQQNALAFSHQNAIAMSQQNARLMDELVASRLELAKHQFAPVSVVVNTVKPKVSKPKVSEPKIVESKVVEHVKNPARVDGGIKAAAYTAETKRIANFQRIKYAFSKWKASIEDAPEHVKNPARVAAGKRAAAYNAETKRIANFQRIKYAFSKWKASKGVVVFYDTYE